ncbi:hypothetical protein VHEMI03072 [[Torrubiella] hemipterigena]|uniref:Uncharacterized protein n=1 Tax=[Torrubiella] hemipterigena TaxID=1531966 RepID=A0A0A1TA15_9HYPO|nr:hypothetical protein VHEMI03072 [[Torrubiella] hemipterigena]
MKRTLRQGSYAALNLFYLKFADIGSGYAAFPVKNPSKKQFDEDMALQGWKSTPAGGGNGRVKTHEIGGCQDPGDHIDDAPAENDSRGGKCDERDTCPKMPGKDPIQNHMSYATA